jgi:GTP-binding protein
MIETFLVVSTDIALAVLLLDIRHEPTDDDRQMYYYLKNRGLPVVIVLTKSDKLSNNGKASQKALISKGIKLVGNDTLFPFSSVTKAETAIIWDQIEAMIPSIKNA